MFVWLKVQGNGEKLAFACDDTTSLVDSMQWVDRRHQLQVSNGYNHLLVGLLNKRATKLVFWNILKQIPWKEWLLCLGNAASHWLLNRKYKHAQQAYSLHHTLSNSNNHYHQLSLLVQSTFFLYLKFWGFKYLNSSILVIKGWRV